VAELILAHMTHDGRAEWFERPDTFSAQQRARMHTMSRATPTDDLSQMAGGRAAKPTKPIALYDSGGNQIFIVGAGQTEVAEMEDIIARERERKQPTQDELRERFGMPSTKDAGRMMAEAIARRREAHRRNPRTDPPRRPAPAPDPEVWRNA
jgi:hypothetical protein